MKKYKLYIVLLLTTMVFSQISYGDEIAIGTKIGMFSETDQIIYVNGQRVQGYLVEGELTMCVESFTDLVYGTNLRYPIRDYSIDFLENMKRLKVLFIGSNRLTNFDVIAGMSYLEELGFEGNEITDVSSLYSLKNLKVMSIDGKYVDETVNVSKTGVPIIVYHVSLGGMGGATHRSVIKEFVLPFGKRAMNYEFAVDNIRHSGRNSYIIEVESGDPRYELIIEKEYAIPCVDEDIEQKNWDIEVIEKAKISGKIVLGDRLLSVENKDYLEREIAIYARINDEKRRAICLGKVDQNEFEYELYLPKAYKGQAFTLEYAVKDYGHFDFRAHFGTIGNMIYNGFLQLDGMLSPNGDDAGRVQFDGGDMVIEDVFVEI